MVDSFIRSLLGSTESLNGLSSNEDYLRASSDALKIPRTEASPANRLSIKDQAMVKNFIQQRNLATGKKANGCKLHCDFDGFRLL